MKSPTEKVNTTTPSFRDVAKGLRSSHAVARQILRQSARKKGAGRPPQSTVPMWFHPQEKLMVFWGRYGKNEQGKR